jgi:ubiquinone/menaquinone biosynthesis C-methylase UbiE
MNLVSYYKDRAKEYEKIYSKPERQDDLQNASIYLQHVFADKNVLEIACGTGYWTERIAASASSIFATDVNESVIDVAKRKIIPNQNVSFGVADIYNFNAINKYESLFGGFIMSHIKMQDIDKFLMTINNLVYPRGKIVFMDNNFVEGSNLPITNTDEEGNTFQTRKLEDGSIHLVLKNFHSENFLRLKLNGIADEVKFIKLKYYWILEYNNL